MDESQYVTPPPQLASIVQRTADLGFTMASEPLTGSLLQALAASKPSGTCLELGTGTGMATAWLLAGLDSTSSLTTVDSNGQVQSVAAEALGDDGRIRFVLEDGLAFLMRQQSETFDLVFADAMPGKFEGLDEALRVLRPGGFYIVDDLLPQPNWPEGHAAKVPDLLDTLRRRKDFVMSPMNWATGLAVAVKR
jgi:predicted O-methyltransferase YrrM